MSHRFYPIALHRNEWERLKRQGGLVVPQTTAADPRAEYSDALNEQSKKLINLWSDSAESLREKQKQLRRKERKEYLAFVNAFRKSRNHERQEAVERAKQMIFDNSCYGQQLISAITESNILEERKAQIEFQKEIKQKEADLEKNKTYGGSPFVSDVGDEAKMKANKKLAALECVKFNEEIELMKKKKAAQLKAEKIICESVDEDMVKQVKEVKAKKMTELKLSVKKGIEEYEEERKEIKKQRQKNEDRDNALIKVYKKEQDRMRCKVDAVLREILEEKQHCAIKFYKVIDEIQKAEKKRYKDFIEKGIETYEQRYAKQEAKETEIENKKRAERYKISEENKVAAVQHKLYLKHTAPGNCACHVQTLLFKPKAAKKPVNKLDPEVNDSKKIGRDCSEESKNKDNSKEEKFSFLKPHNKLVEALRRREKESSGYTGVEGADKYFAEQASDALQRTKHKYFARKVVDEYLKVNCLDSSNLSISNY